MSEDNPSRELKLASQKSERSLFTTRHAVGLFPARFLKPLSLFREASSYKIM